MYIILETNTAAQVINRGIVTMHYASYDRKYFTLKDCYDYDCYWCLFIVDFVVVVFFNNHLTSIYFSCLTIYIFNLYLM
jgi:hypothetical protein